MRRQPVLKAVYTTGYTATAIVHNGMVDPGGEVLTKPYGLEQLARKVRRVLQGQALAFRRRGGQGGGGNVGEV